MGFRAATNVANGSSGVSVTINKPTGTVAGDRLVMILGAAGPAAQGCSTPSGFTPLRVDLTSGGAGSPFANASLFERYCDGSEPSSWTVSTNTNGNQVKGGVCLCFTGRDTGPATVFSTTSIATNTNTPAALPFTGIDVPSANCDIVYLAAVAELNGASTPSITGPSGFTDASGGLGATQFLAFLGSYLLNQPAGPTGTLTGTATATTGVFRAAGFVLALKQGGPTITSQPTDQTVNVGGTATFTTAATAQIGTVTYQWQDDSGGSFADISGATSSSYALSSTTYAMQNRQHRCIETDSVGSVTSSVAYLRVAFQLAGTGPRVKTAFGSIFGYGPFNFEQRGASSGNSYSLTCAQGSYSYSGQTATLLSGRKVAAVQGSYSLTGQIATLRKGFTATAAQGSYSLTGQAASLLYGHRLTAVAGSYSLSGQVAALRVGRLALSAVQGGYTYTGQTALLRQGRQLAIGQGSYALSGQVASLRNTRALALAQGSYSLSGQTAALARTRRLTAAFGAYNLNGQAASLTYGLAIAMLANTGTYAITGQAATFRLNRRVQIGQGSYSLSGQTAAFFATRRFSANLGIYALTGQLAALNRTRALLSSVGTYVLTGNSATFEYTKRVLASLGTYVVDGQNVTLIHYSSFIRSIERTLKIEADLRYIAIVADKRGLVIEPEMRGLGIEPERRRTPAERP